MTVREVLIRYPSLEPVFDRHGLRGCGGPNGPQEPLDFFASVHKVDVKRLIQDLNTELPRTLKTAGEGASGNPARPTTKPSYSLFLRTSLALAVTFGFGLGVLLLLNRLPGTPLAPFGPVGWLSHVQIHGAVQIYGWIGLFILGMALHILPRFKGVSPSSLRFALTVYGTMLVGLGARVLAQPFPGGLLRDSLLLLSGLALPLGGLLFTGFVLRILRRSRKREVYDLYLSCAAFWLLVSAAGHGGQMLYLVSTGAAFLPDTINEPVTHAALLGFAGLFTMGVSQRVLPSFLSLSAPSRNAMLAAAVFINAGLLTRFVAALAAVYAGSPWLMNFSYLGTISEGAGLVIFSLTLFPWRTQSRLQFTQGEPAAYRRYIQAAYAWLVIAAFTEAGLALRGLLLEQPSYLEASAGRHALALGFLTLMVTGFALRVIPVFGGTRLVWPRLAGVAFWLLLASVSLRVPFTLVPLPTPELASLLTGASGMSGLLGLLCWGTVIWRTLDDSGTPARRRRPAEPEHSPDHVPLIQLQARPADKQGVIGGGMTPAEVVERFPGALRVFAGFGFDMLADEKLRNTIGREITLEQAARMRAVPLSELLADLNELAAAEIRSKD